MADIIDIDMIMQATFILWMLGMLDLDDALIDGRQNMHDET